MATIILLLAAILPAVLCQAPETYLQSLSRELVPPGGPLLPYSIRLLFQDDAQVIQDVCQPGNNVTVRELCTEVNGYQRNKDEPAMSRSPCTGMDRNLGTSVYRVTPKVCIKERRLMTLEFYGTHVFLVMPEPTDRFCLFMLDAGVAGNPRMMPLHPFIHWAVCNIQGGNLTTGTELIEYMPVSAEGTESKRIVWALCKQPNGGLADPIDNFVATVPICDPTPGRCQFDVVNFAVANNLEVSAVLVTRAAPDIVGLNMERPFVDEAITCQLYMDLTENYPPPEDGCPTRHFWCKYRSSYYTSLP